MPIINAYSRPLQMQDGVSSFPVVADPVLISESTSAVLGRDPNTGIYILVEGFFGSSFASVNAFTFYEADQSPLGKLSGLQISGSFAQIEQTLARLSDISFLLGGVDSFYGSEFNDVIRGYGGNDYISGGSGIDIALFSGFGGHYSVSRLGGDIIVSGPDGSDRLNQVERIGFADGILAFDFEGTAGRAYRLYEAALNRVPDPAGLGAWTRALDAGTSLAEVAWGFINSPEFMNRFSTAQTDAGFVDALYQNVLDRLPDAIGKEYWELQLNSGVSRADVLIGFSESAENKNATISNFDNGVWFV
ncbi:DUF4214 domain-containing protein [Salinarimonas ramus]|uniref:DUF4214 domain-containing protein n=1 Tax=Salinarimonas ramus TaxID=690164 RepID=A0A917Q5P6_9HYPH|nr:DUF4214 domain-containing protein [Salinarimonas ramus]GGK28271.1 hypothetical protein GCM10011322_13480 [Salinarimonas ramus]